MANLVAFFSPTGRTKKVAKKLAEAVGADLYEIRPAVPYSKADLDWKDKKSRTTVEMNDKSFRPEIIADLPDMAKYDTVYLGFPIWWYVAPTVINSFLESADFSGKKICLFATSGMSGFGDTVRELQPSAPGAELVEMKVLSGILYDSKIEELKKMA